MDTVFLCLLIFSLSAAASSSSPTATLTGGSSLSVEKANDVFLISPNGVFTAGFLPAGDNAFCFAIWFTRSKKSSQLATVVWMANRDRPVNGKGSKVTLSTDGNLILMDAGETEIWATNTRSSSSVELHLADNGNLVLGYSENESESELWQSFNSPTDTLLPQQPLTRYTSLVSSRSRSNSSSGFFKLLFDYRNVLCLLYDGPDFSSIYWPDPWLMAWDAGRTIYNNSKTAMFDSAGYFKSSDALEFRSSDFGFGPLRRLTLDVDGNLRLYSLNAATGNWIITWQALSDPCRVHGLCGPNSICTYGRGAGRGCSCILGYVIKSSEDWSNGCRERELNESSGNLVFASLGYVEFYGNDYDFLINSTLEMCREKCLQSNLCKGFLYKYEGGVFKCYVKSLLLNGKQSPNLLGNLFIKLNVSTSSGILPPNQATQMTLNCSAQQTKVLDRTYHSEGKNKFLNFLLWLAVAVGGLEILVVIVMSRVMYSTPNNSTSASQGYILAATGFRKFSYKELQKATQQFSEEIGRGGSGVVYKGILSDNRVAAIKRLHECAKGETTEFLAEISIIGRINHMNLIQLWGYCDEGKHRLLVYEYMEHGSLSQSLSSKTLNWEKRFNIAVGTARGLAYLHEECLEWVLHCDIKPQNIVLDSEYQPKVADFGLSKLLNRSAGVTELSLSMIRGTRGYMAPEWVLNLSITSKVDVYSYGIVMLEMITGRSPIAVQWCTTRLVSWVREKIPSDNQKSSSWIEEIADPRLVGEYDPDQMELLVRVALQCAEENGDARPTMKQVIQMLLHNEKL